MAGQDIRTSAGEASSKWDPSWVAMLLPSITRKRQRIAISVNRFLSRYAHYASVNRVMFSRFVAATRSGACYIDLCRRQNRKIEIAKDGDQNELLDQIEHTSSS